VRLGVHTGLVVVGDVGAGHVRAVDARGDTPYCGRLPSLAAPNTLVISAATYHLIAAISRVRRWGRRHSAAWRSLCKSIESSMAVGSRAVLRSRRPRPDAAGGSRAGSRAPEGALTRVKAAMGQVVVLEGEAGLGSHA